MKPSPGDIVTYSSRVIDFIIEQDPVRGYYNILASLYPIGFNLEQVFNNTFLAGFIVETKSTLYTDIFNIKEFPCSIDA